MNHQTYLLLSFLKNVAHESAEMATLFFESGYYAQKYAARRTLGDTSTYTTARMLRHEEKRRLLKNYRQRLYVLEQDGLISRSRKNKEITFTITKIGKERLNKIYLNENLVRDYTYEKKKSEYPTIVTFDIPERWRGKRNWLREALRELEFTMIQKSVWIGMNKIPESLIKDLHDSKIFTYIDFFEVKKDGTIPISLHDTTHAIKH